MNTETESQWPPQRKWATGVKGKLFLYPLVLLLAGCTTVYDGKYNFNDGWREAKVIQVGRAGEIARPQFSDCRENSPFLSISSGVYALLSYQHLNRPRKRVVPLLVDELRPGQKVYMKVTDCVTPLVLRER